MTRANLARRVAQLEERQRPALVIAAVVIGGAPVPDNHEPVFVIGGDYDTCNTGKTGKTS